jgi:hypothetical protein
MKNAATLFCVIIFFTACKQNALPMHSRNAMLYKQLSNHSLEEPVDGNKKANTQMAETGNVDLNNGTTEF